jgi:hypothetical protein
MCEPKLINDPQQEFGNIWRPFVMKAHETGNR